LELWKQTIEAGNRCFNAGLWVEAREHYLQALALAQVLFERWQDVNAAVAAFVVSQHNLADLHLMLGQPEEAAECLCACHERLLKSRSDERLPRNLRAAALHHSSRTYSVLLHFIAEYGAYPRTDRLVAQAVSPSITDASLPPTIRQLH